MEKLHRRMLVLPARYRRAELLRINEIERRFVTHLVTVVNTVNAHTDAALEPLIARAEGRVPGQTATERKREIDQALLATRTLREERKALVEEERAEKAANMPAAKRRKTAPAPEMAHLVS
jgi:hypothetical protein